MVQPTTLPGDIQSKLSYLTATMHPLRVRIGAISSFQQKLQLSNELINRRFMTEL